ncbi:uncharacterized protein AB675_3004 [Cyphellophora attinorum]|uniref:Uncharacterized protein n=1 Tax=Cyphellophora attinorum TaxID=1664694 RepID=A0A0N0NJ28_9EURO|nr:uncharacterized protein AB675_3004 [Phialophora attinorum]KPI36438.1 hypothetical protein AB675_3004 [Phialophora attinorum]
MSKRQRATHTGSGRWSRTAAHRPHPQAVNNPKPVQNPTSVAAKDNDSSSEEDGEIRPLKRMKLTSSTSGDYHGPAKNNIRGLKNTRSLSYAEGSHRGNRSFAKLKSNRSLSYSQVQHTRAVAPRHHSSARPILSGMEPADLHNLVQAYKAAEEAQKLEAQRQVVDRALRKIEKWADMWLEGKLSGDEDWATLGLAWMMPDN